MNRDSNAYTFLFATIMVLVVASALAFTASSLKDLQAANVRKEKMQNILATVGINIRRDQAEDLYKKYITAELSLTKDGTVDEKTDAFEIKLSNELKKPVSEQRFPIYEANLDEEKFYIIPLRGAGLWNAIWGYIAMDENMVVKGAYFDHKGETPGLGANIKQRYFMDDFYGEKLLTESGEFKGITVAKGNNDPKNLDKDDYEVDALAGATITGDGVSAMIKSDLKLYLPFFKNLKNQAN